MTLLVIWYSWAESRPGDGIRDAALNTTLFWSMRGRGDVSGFKQVGMNNM